MKYLYILDYNINIHCTLWYVDVCKILYGSLQLALICGWQLPSLLAYGDTAIQTLGCGYGGRFRVVLANHRWSAWKQEVLLKLMTGTHKPCKYIGRPPSICADPPNSGALESLRPSHWKAIISVPEFLRHRKLRHSESWVPQVPWPCRAGRENRKNMPPIIHISICMWVCLSACLYIIQCCHWTWNYEKDRVWSWWSPTPPGNIIIYRIHSLYFFVIRFSTFEVSPVSFEDSFLPNDLQIPETPTLGVRVVFQILVVSIPAFPEFTTSQLPNTQLLEGRNSRHLPKKLRKKLSWSVWDEVK